MTLAFCKNSLMFISCLTYTCLEVFVELSKDHNITCNMEVFSSSL